MSFLTSLLKEVFPFSHAPDRRHIEILSKSIAANHGIHQRRYLGYVAMLVSSFLDAKRIEESGSSQDLPYATKDERDLLAYESSLRCWATTCYAIQKPT